MILAWMLYSFLLGGAAGAAALALDGAARALGRPTRHVWVLALAFSTLWPAWLLVRSALPAGGGDAALGAALLPPLIVTAGRDAVHAMTERIAAFAERASPALLAAWLLTTAALVLRHLLGVRSLRRQRALWSAREVDGVRVLVTRDTGPAVVGVRRPEVVLPEWALALDPGLRALVVRHEAEHVAARDTAPRLLGAVLTALMPWNAALWWQADRLALAIEVDCDRRVLRADARRERYGLLLLAIAQHQSAAALAPALSEPTSHLERRISVMHRSKPRRPALVAAGLTAAATTALAIACSVPAPNAAAGPGRQQAPAAAAAPAAQGDSASTAPDGTPRKFFEFKLDKQATPLPESLAPRYPDALREQNKAGEVVVTFVVDEKGVVNPSTIKVLESADPAFSAAVRDALASWRFSPAEAGGRPVKQLIRQTFTFGLKR